MRARVATVDDAAEILAIYGPIVEATAISFEVVPPTLDEMRERIRTKVARLPWLVGVGDDGRVEGYVYASPHRDRAAYQWSVDAAVYVREDCRGRGLARGLYALLFDEVARLGYFQAFAGITLPNAASVALHEAVGFVKLGVYRDVGYKHGAWRDVGWWQKRLRNGVAGGPSPDAPRLFDKDAWVAPAR